MHVGDKIPPWRTPLDIVKQVDVSLPHFIQISDLAYYTKTLVYVL